MKLGWKVQSLNFLLFASVMGISSLMGLSLYQAYRYEVKDAHERLLESLKDPHSTLENVFQNSEASVVAIQSMLDELEMVPPSKREFFVKKHISGVIQAHNLQYNAYIALEPELAKSLFGQNAFVQTVTRDWDKEGVFHSKIWSDPIYLKSSNEIWYEVAKKSEKVEYTGLYFDENYMKSWLITVAKGYFEDGRFLGMGGVDISLDEILVYIFSVDVGNSGGIVIIDGNTRKEVRVGKPSDFYLNVLEGNFDPQTGRPVEDVIKGKDGKNYFLASQPLAFSNWYLLSYQEANEAMGSYYKVLAVMLTVYGLILVILFLTKAKIQKGILRTEEVIEKQRLQNEANRKMASLARVTAGIAHEIKNPLNIIANSNLIIREAIKSLEFEIKSGGGMDSIEEELDVIREASIKQEKHTLRATGIISNMLKLSRKESAEMGLVEVDACIREALSFVNAGVRSRPFIDIDVALELNSKAKIYGFKEELTRAFINIIDNAFDALAEKSLTEELFRGVLQVRTFVDSDAVVVVEFIDNGTGLTKETERQMFDPFYTTKRAGAGTGLGMSLVDEIVKKHRGRVDMENFEGKGLTIRLRFPVKV